MGQAGSHPDIVMAFRTGPLGSGGQCVYHRGDYALEYQTHSDEREPGAPPTLADAINNRLRIHRARPRFLISADTLVLVFEGTPPTLVALDGYTNEANWRPSTPRLLPPVREDGALYLARWPEDDDRYAFDSEPRYEITEDRRTLRIVFSAVQAEERYRVGLDLVAGLHSGMVTDLWLLNMHFTP